jgi:DNA primase
VQALKRANDIHGIRQLYGELTDYYHSCLAPEHRTYLLNRGFTDETISAYRIGYVPDTTHILYRNEYVIDGGIVRKDGTPFLLGRLIFPYMVGSVVTDMRGRLFVGESEQKYLSPYGGSFYRGADYPYSYDNLAQHEKIVLTEGEAKAIASNQAGVPTVSIPGILSLRPQLKQRDNQTFTVCFDSQVEHWYDVIRAIQRLAKKFQNLLIATLPLLGREKMDIDTFINDYGADKYKDVISRAIPYSNWLSLVRV